MKNISDKDKLNALNEIRLLASVKHPNVVSFKEAFIDHASQNMCVVMEYCERGDLLSLVEKVMR